MVAPSLSGRAVITGTVIFPARRAANSRSARLCRLSALGDYFRLKPAEADHTISDLADEGVLVPVQVEGWSQKAWKHRDVRNSGPQSGSVK